jgi:hypothetical protein
MRRALRVAAVAWLVSRTIVLLALVLHPGYWHDYLHTWDAGFYRTISVEGYDPVGNPPIDLVKPAFFPLLPAVEHGGSLLAGDPAWWGAAVAAACSFAALAALHRLTAERFSVRVADLAVWAVALLPFSYVLSTGYTEGPFLLLSVLAYAATLRGRAVAAAPAAFLASLLRPTGILLVPAFAWDAWRHRERRVAALAAAAGAALGPLVFFVYLRQSRGNFFASLKAQREGWHRSVSLAAAPGDLARYVWQAVSWPRLTYITYLLAVPLCLAGLTVLWRRGVRDGPFVYAAAVLAAPLSTGSAMSLPRFVMAAFPYAWAAGLGLERLPRRWRIAALVALACGIPVCMWGTYWQHRLAP